MIIVARTQYDERPALESDLDFANDKGLTKQSDAKDCDLNAMFKRFEKTGELPEMIVKNGHYGDFASVPTLQEAIAISRHAQEQFDALDVHVRNRFENDPVKFHEFVTNPENADEIEKMGLMKPEVVEARRAARAAKAKEESEARRKEEAEKPLDPELVAKMKKALGL